MASKSLPPSREGQLYALAQAVERHDILVKALLKRVDELEMNREIARASCCWEHEKALSAVKKFVDAYRQLKMAYGRENAEVTQELVDPVLKIVNEALALRAEGFLKKEKK